jgi:hypothetical protein
MRGSTGQPPGFLKMLATRIETLARLADEPKPEDE